VHQARELYEQGAGKIGTNENTFVDIFCGHSLAQMQEVARAYEINHGSSLERAVKSEFSGKIETALCLLLQDPIDSFCMLLQRACSGIGTDEKVVSRLIGGNEKETVFEIAARYKQKYDKSLVDVLSSELSGDFRNAVVTYISTRDASDGVEALNREAAELASLQAVAAPPTAPPKTAAPVQAPLVASPPPAPVAVSSAPPPAAAPVSTPTTPPEVIKGWGHKEGHLIRNWKRRFFVFTSAPSATVVVYYEFEEQNKPYGAGEKGSINLRGYTTSMLDDDTIYLKGKNESDKDLKIRIEDSVERVRMLNGINQHLEYRKYSDEMQRKAQISTMR
jgi:hypothetical protein